MPAHITYIPLQVYYIMNITKLKYIKVDLVDVCAQTKI